MEFIIDEKTAKTRLDVFLALATGQTRSQIQKQIKAGLVLVNGATAKVHEFLRLNDSIQINVPAKQTIKQENKESLKSKYKSQKSWNFFSFIKSLFKRKEKTIEPIIIFQNKDYLVMEKPAGLLVHPTEKNENNTLAHWLVKKVPEIAKVQDTVSLQKENTLWRPGIIHRLDKDVSGLMLVARTQDAFDYFKTQFKLKTIKKEYLALLHGELPRDEGEINFEISRKETGEKMACHPAGSGKGKPALTQYEVIQRFKNFTFVKAYPLTGRTNQIRAHFFALGFPIVNDTVYTKFKISSYAKAPRLAIDE